jgi:hypothetical protein
MRSLAVRASVVALSLFVLTGCKSALGALSGSSSSPAASSSAGPSVQARSGGLLAVHDPKQVTYSITVGTCHALPGPRPDPACTPGSYDPSVTQANLATTICRSGYTATVRPSVSETDTAKRTLYTDYGIAAGTTSELDHLVSLELGGSNDVANLWPEVGKVPNPKDTVENDLHKAVCSGKVQLAAAQQAIAADWTTAEHVLGLG